MNGRSTWIVPVSRIKPRTPSTIPTPIPIALSFRIRAAPEDPRLPLSYPDRAPCMRAARAGYLSGMTTVLPYLLAVLLTPIALALMLFLVARLEGGAPREPRLPPVP